MPDFSAHGDFTIQWQDSILILYVSGSYNLEGAERVNQAYSKICFLTY